MLLVARILGTLGGATVGLRTAMVADRSFEGERSRRREVAAVLVGNATGTVAIRESESQPGWAQVRWTTPDGQTRTGRTRVPAHSSAGTQVFGLDKEPR